MNIKEIKNKEEWEKFLLNVEEKTFLQSWGWGKFQENLGNKIWRLGVYQDGELIASSLVVKIIAKRGTFIFLPHGPVVKKEKENIRGEILSSFLAELKNIAKEERAVFIRISPVWERTEENKNCFKKLGFRKAPIHMHPEETWEMDISSSEKEILMNMRKNTRYLIRKGDENKEIEVIKSNDKKDINIFNNLYEKVADRHNFVPFSKEYLNKELDAFSSDDNIAIFLSKYKGEVLASAIVVYWQGTGFYHHGASSLKHSKIPTSYSLQWEAMLEGKKRGCTSYNFWGVAPEKSSKNHPWAGLTLFKKGFGGRRKKYVETQDLILFHKYWINWGIEKIRKKRRGL
jgi:lipid II:glycine glycyltransferase (peptidoglycan interpeptide bridge formation enzyme)